MTAQRSGPLCGVRIVEFAGVGPGPFCAMLLADMGAEVICVDRVTPHGLGIKKESRFNPIHRNRPSVAIDTKSSQGRDLALKLVARADGLIEGFRPGVMERLGLGPADCEAVNPRIVYGRMTGWGQEGPLADVVGHDLNYLAMSGVLPLLGGANDKPAIPLNLIGDFGGGGIYLALGMVSAILEARTSGRGQVVDAAIIDGVSSLLTNQYGYAGSGTWSNRRESNVIDGGAPWYNIYATSDNKYVSVAAVEPKFYRELLRGMGLDSAILPDQNDRSAWPAMKKRFAAVFAAGTRDQWCERMAGLEACFAPVLDIDEVVSHPHSVARRSFLELEGVVQPIPAPRFSRTQSEVTQSVPTPGRDSRAVLRSWGVADDEIEGLLDLGVVLQS